MNAVRGVGSIAWLAVLVGCANPVAKHYVALEGTDGPAAGATAAVEIRQVVNLTEEEARLRRDGWREIGRAAFQETGTLNRAQVVNQARSVGADLVLWHGWSIEENRLGEPHMTSAANPGVDVSGSAGKPTYATVPVTGRSRETYTVTVTHVTISFWRQTAAKPSVIEPE